MKAKIQISENVEIEVEGENTKELFTQLASIEQSFGMKSQLCGKCKKTTNKRYIARNAGGNMFYEIVCECGAHLSLSASKENPNNLFPKKKEDYTKPDSPYLPDNGWRIYNPKTNKME